MISSRLVFCSCRKLSHSSKDIQLVKGQAETRIQISCSSVLSFVLYFSVLCKLVVLVQELQNYMMQWSHFCTPIILSVSGNSKTRKWGKDPTPVDLLALLGSKISFLNGIIPQVIKPSVFRRFTSVSLWGQQSSHSFLRSLTAVLFDYHLIDALRLSYAFTLYLHWAQTGLILSIILKIHLLMPNSRLSALH